MTAAASTASGLSTDVPLILLAAFHHPDTATRTALRARVEEAIETARPLHRADAVRAYLEGERGTVIEPFALDATSLDLAVAVARLAFSGRLHHTRLRVVSCETIGTEGGLVLTDNLRSYYAERFVHGRHRVGRDSRCFVAPAVAADEALRSAARSASRGEIALDGQGVRISVPLVTDGQPPAQLARVLQERSRVLGVGQSFARLGIRVECTATMVTLRSGSSEGLLQLLALCERRAVVALDRGTRDGHGAMAFVRLTPPAEAPTPLPVLLTATASYPSPWIALDRWPEIAMTREERLAVARWIPPHESWVDDLLEELL